MTNVPLFIIILRQTHFVLSLGAQQDMMFIFDLKEKKLPMFFISTTTNVFKICVRDMRTKIRERTRVCRGAVVRRPLDFS